MDQPGEATARLHSHGRDLVMDSPFHLGEQAIQSQLGVQNRIESQGRRIIRDYLLDEHRQFFTQLSYLLVGTVDAADCPWASVVVGPPGFLTSPDAYMWSCKINYIFLSESFEHFFDMCGQFTYSDPT